MQPGASLTLTCKIKTVAQHIAGETELDKYVAQLLLEKIDHAHASGYHS